MYVCMVPLVRRSVRMFISVCICLSSSLTTRMYVCMYVCMYTPCLSSWTGTCHLVVFEWKWMCLAFIKHLLTLFRSVPQSIIIIFSGTERNMNIQNNLLVSTISTVQGKVYCNYMYTVYIGTKSVCSPRLYFMNNIFIPSHHENTPI